MADAPVLSQTKAQQLIDGPFPGNKAIGGFAATRMSPTELTIVALFGSLAGWLVLFGAKQYFDARSDSSTARLVLVVGAVAILAAGMVGGWLLERRHCLTCVVVVTDDGIAVGAKHLYKPAEVRSWILSPPQGYRYEVDPERVHKAENVVDLTIEGRRLFAIGPARDEAFRLYSQQPPVTSKAMPQGLAAWG